MRWQAITRTNDDQDIGVLSIRVMKYITILYFKSKVKWVFLSRFEYLSVTLNNV